jgi:hypothetical protein
VKRVLWGLLLIVVAAAGCARVASTSLIEVTDGKAHPDQYLHVQVAEVRTTTQLLVQLGDGHRTIWASGFKKSPLPGSDVWTSVIDKPRVDDQVGQVYPTSGALPAPSKGLTETGTLIVIVGIVLALALLLPAIAGVLIGARPTRRCASCGSSVDATWRTCPSCGTGTGAEPEADEERTDARTLNPTVVTSAAAAEEPTARMPSTPDPSATEIETQPPATGTRLFRRED